jgi:hypothetical protein
MNFLSKKKLKHNFRKQVDEYFNHIWTYNMGFNDNELLAELPASLKSDIRLTQYAHVIQKSPLFCDEEGNVDTQLTRSIFRVMNIVYYMSGDTIISAGDRSKEVYIVLHGEVRVIDMNGNRLLATLK